MQARWRNSFKGNRRNDCREGTGSRHKLLEEGGKDATRCQHTKCESLKNTYGKISVCGCSKKHKADNFSSNASELSNQRAHKSSKRGRKLSATMAVHDGSKRNFDANDKISLDDVSTGSA
jgi:hypothetical protein